MASRREAWAVVDLGFGDAGKGTIVDFLARQRGAGLVVRFNGGAQAGHNVVTPGGRHHTFAQFGAGTFVPGVETHLGPAFLLHPGGLLVEAGHLAAKQVPDALARLTIDARARLITPFQQAAGRLRELARGSEAHGTCGVGVGETVADFLAGWDDVLTAVDLADLPAARRRLAWQQERKRCELERNLDEPRAVAEWAVLDEAGMVERVLAAWSPLATARILDRDAAHRRICDAEAVLFEGAQGVLLDETWGFHPHTTWSDCTFAGAAALLDDRPLHRLGVLRAYATRHGPGPFPTWDPDFDRRLPEPHNESGGWQGAFRRGPLDTGLLRYAISACGGVDSLALTCFDRVADWPLVPLCHAYEESGSKPILTRVAPSDLVGEISSRLGARASILSQGPAAGDKQWL